MTIRCPFYSKCDLPTKSLAVVRVNDVELCSDMWNKATTEEREWFMKATSMYNRGFITKQELRDAILGICYHHIDPTAPVYI